MQVLPLSLSLVICQNHIVAIGDTWSLTSSSSRGKCLNYLHTRRCAGQDGPYHQGWTDMLPRHDVENLWMVYNILKRSVRSIQLLSQLTSCQLIEVEVESWTVLEVLLVLPSPVFFSFFTSDRRPSCRTQRSNATMAILLQPARPAAPPRQRSGIFYHEDPPDVVGPLGPPRRRPS